MRRAEQRWPAESESGGENVADHLLGEGGGIRHECVLAAGLRDERDGLTRRGQALRELPLDEAGDRRRSVKITP